MSKYMQFREGFLKIIVIVMGNLNANVGSDNTLLEHVLAKHGLGDHNDNGGRFVQLPPPRHWWHIVREQSLP